MWAKPTPKVVRTSSHKLSTSLEVFLLSEPVLLYGDLASLLVSMAMFVTQLKSPPKIVEGDG